MMYNTFICNYQFFNKYFVQIFGYDSERICNSYLEMDSAQKHAAVTHKPTTYTHILPVSCIHLLS